MNRQTLSIVISAFNEEGNILSLYESICLNLERTGLRAWEILFVNDGSDDGTLDRCIGIAKQDGRVKIINLLRNFGHETAMTAGMDHAAYEGVLFMDADHQHPPELIPEMVRLWQQGYDIVLSRRTGSVGKPMIRRALTAIFYRILNVLSDVPIPENSPDFRLLDRKYITMLRRMKERRRMFRGMMNWIGTARAATVDFVSPERKSGMSKYRFRTCLSLAADSIVQFSIRPLRFATYTGFFSAFLSILLGAYTVWEFFVRNTPKTGYSTIVTIIVFIGSVQLIALGIIGEYIGRIHLEVRERPLYFADIIDARNADDFRIAPLRTHPDGGETDSQH